ncbi:PREDICTED: receptor-like protein kinase HSL1 isoform X2 [Camelina sativa]|uniref:Receptor-like protein kinase HSL1 isoform X1 n=1 Tax=Camelina sativa TaxID=90675 RepID=A0ABM0YDL0_CAMSA|nr:PREDICTED: receptor-like protein kinase HSL1 isoform X1 [Camelina sativa]XP_010499375.1 PREDICTED: receptor-like protein kinase HSL1 isoform X2 [Camelina sativa]
MYLYLFLFLLFPTIFSLNQEAFILQQVKHSLDDPDSSLSSWNSTDDSPCRWFGVSCGGDFTSVTSVDLSGANLAGPFPSVICRLSKLAELSLYNNSINSTLPLDVAACNRLQLLDLSQNLLTGEIPHTLADIPTLVHLDLTGNNFSGDIPANFGKFQNLEVLSLVYNLLDGTIPPFLGNISSLKMLNLSYNPFSPSRIPPELGNLTNLEVMWLTECHLIGQIPDSLGRLSRLVDLDLALNDLVGPIPRSLGGLSSVVQIELYNNSLTGEIPPELGNLKSLRLLDASMNQLTGKIPEELCRVPLESLNLYENNLEGEVPGSIALSPNLYELRIFGNRLTGELPRDLGRNSPLRWLDVSENEFSGELPADLCEKGELEELLIIHNSFSGAIAETLGDCKSLTRVRLAYNKFSGSVPTGFWGLPHVYLLELINNSFSGEIAKSIGGASNLSLLILSNNQFTGSLPEEIGVLNNLNQLSASGNKFSGSLPVSLMQLGELGILDLHGNQFSGELTPGIKSWKKLNELNLADNEFTGRIPDEIGSLSVLNYLDLSGNQFSGKIPVSLQSLKLNQLNLSYNRLSGDLPPSLAKEVYKNSFIGNPGLCGAIKGLCDSGDKAKKRGLWLLRLIFVLAAIVFVAGVAWFYFKYRTYKKARAIERSKWTLMSFHKLGFSEHEILESLDEDNVIGAGASGKVYKVVLTNGETVAVKRLWTGSVKDTEDCDPEKGNRPGVQDEAFEAEVETLGKIRHKNIVKLWCCCSTRDCKLLVYEYMPNGSLGDLLHSSKGGMLAWQTRFKIILDAAEGLSYLHHDCVPPIVHRDIKSNNILIDGDYGARVADFGVAKAVDLTGKAPKSMSVIAGSCGYIAPEYAYTLRVNEKSDIYSFGVVILEIVTRKRPVDPELGEKDLVKWVCTTLDQKGIEHVIDPKLDSCFKEEISKILNVGLLCTSPLPINRPSMRRVVKMLQEIGGGDEESQNKIRDDKDGKLTPYYHEETSDQGSVA